MSRTYRCRHMPVHAGKNKFRKIVEGCRRTNGDREEIAEQLTARVLGPQPTKHTTTVKGPGFTHRVYHYGEDPPRAVNMNRYLTNYGWYEVVPGKIMRTWESWHWSKVRNMISEDLVLPRGSWHPWQRRPPAGGRKKFQRIFSNRRNRHHDRQMIRSEIIDEDWTGHFANKKTYFNWWDIY